MFRPETVGPVTLRLSLESTETSILSSSYVNLDVLATQGHASKNSWSDNESEKKLQQRDESWVAGSDAVNRNLPHRCLGSQSPPRHQHNNKGNTAIF